MAPPKSRRSAFYRGDAGREKAEEELARSKARAEARKAQGNMPFRFRVGVGETAQFVILDDAPDFFRFEHNLKNPQTGKWDIFTGCVKEWDNCPVCAASDKEAYYALYFTVIDFTEFETRDGTKHEFSRKLLVVKPAQQKKFQRAFSKAEKEGRTLRGAVFEVTRDGEKDSAIGNDIELVDYMEEEDLETYVRTWKDKDGKKHTEKCFEVLDYEQLFEEPDTEKLRALVGGAPAPGSRAHEDRAIGRKSSRRSRDEEDEDEDDDGDWEKADRKGRMKPASKPVAKPSRGRSRQEEEDEPEDEPEDEQEEAPRRGAGRSVASSKKAPPSRRGRADDDDEPPFDTDDDDDEPPRKAPGTGKRIQARGRR